MTKAELMKIEGKDVEIANQKCEEKNNDIKKNNQVHSMAESIEKSKSYNNIQETIQNKLPCKVGDTLYRVALDDLEIYSFKIENIVITSDDIIFKSDSYDGEICGLKHIDTHILYLDLFLIFSNYEDAKEFVKNQKYLASEEFRGE